MEWVFRFFLCFENVLRNEGFYGDRSANPVAGVHIYRSGQARSVSIICDLPQLPRKPVRTCSMVMLAATKPSLPPSFLVRRVYYLDTQQDEEQNLSKGGGAPCEPTAIHI